MIRSGPGRMPHSSRPPGGQPARYRQYGALSLLRESRIYHRGKHLHRRRYDPADDLSQRFWLDIKGGIRSMKTAICYFSYHHGNTLKVAEAMAEAGMSISSICASVKRSIWRSMTASGSPPASMVFPFTNPSSTLPGSICPPKNRSFLSTPTAAQGERCQGALSDCRRKGVPCSGRIQLPRL